VPREQQGIKMRTLTVQTPSHQYPIFIGNNLIEQADVLLKPYLSNKVVIVTNETIAPLYLEAFQTTLDRLGIPSFSIILPDGEEYKNWQTLNLIFDGLMQNRAERKTTLIALGGGLSAIWSALLRRLINEARHLSKCRQHC